MGTDLLPGHQYVDGELINGPSLTEHVSEALIKTTFYSSKTAKDPVVLTDEFVIRETVADSFRKVSLATLQALMVGPGGVIQTSYGEYTVNSNLSAVIPWDDTIPQNTEGTQIISISITPKFITSKILLTVQGIGSISGNANSVISAIFRDAAAPAIAANMSDLPVAGGWSTNIHFNYLDSPSTTSAITYNLRVGPGANTGFLRMNGYDTGRYLGGVMRTTFTAQEIKQ